MLINSILNVEVTVRLSTIKYTVIKKFDCVQMMLDISEAQHYLLCPFSFQLRRCFKELCWNLYLIQRLGKWQRWSSLSSSVNIFWHPFTKLGYLILLLFLNLPAFLTVKIYTCQSYLWLYETAHTLQLSSFTGFVYYFINYKQ